MNRHLFHLPAYVLIAQHLVRKAFKFKWWRIVKAFEEMEEDDGERPKRRRIGGRRKPC